MQLHDFYEHTLPLTGHYAIFRAKSKQHIWCNTIDELVRHTEHYANDVDTYFATASFKEPGSRAQVNVDTLKAFRFDLDAGEKKLEKHGPAKVYASQREALRDFIRFSQESGLEPSIIVSSGEGLHIYYELDTPIPAPQWTRIATHLQTFGDLQQLKIDSAVTADSARVLRPIGTTHPNGNTVSVLRATGKVFTVDEFCAAIGFAGADVPDYGDLSINDEVLAVQGPPKSLKKMLQGCANAMYAARNQATIQEPHWRAMIGLAKHSVEGRKGAHLLSCKHPDYSVRQTDKYFDRYEAGPALCTKLEEFHAESCASCKHRGKVKSPVVLGALTEDEHDALPEDQKMQPPPEPEKKGDPWDGQIPRGFEIVKHKGRRTLVHYLDTIKENEDGEKIPLRVTVPITHEVFWLGHMADAAHSDDSAQVTLFRLSQDGRVNNYTMEQSLVASRAETTKFLASKGIHTTTDKRASMSLEAYVKEQLQRNKDLRQRPKINERFGFHFLPDGRMISAQGKYAIYPDGTITETTLDSALRTVADSYPVPVPYNDSGVWGKEVWDETIMPLARKHADFMRKYYRVKGLERYQLAFMMGLASPLMPFVRGGYRSGNKLPANGLSVSLYSREGGRGKSTVMQSAMLAFGRPDELSKDQNKAGSTDLGRTAILSMSGNLPVGMDEMGTTDDKAMAALISIIANGAGRTRVKQDGGLKVSAPWALTCLLAANKSGREMITAAGNESDAIQYRLLEIDVENMPEFSLDVREEFATAWSAVMPSAGAMGSVINMLICKLGADRISDMVTAKVNEASRLINSTQGDRFQYRGLGAMLMVQELLGMVKLQMFDTTTLVEVFRVCHASANEYIKDNVVSMDGMALLSKALHDMRPYTVITNAETRRNRHELGFDVALNATFPPIVKCRHVVSTGLTYVSKDALRDWCIENKVRLNEILNPIKLNGVMRHVYASNNGSGATGAKQWASQMNLLRGMKESSGGMVACYCFSVHQLAGFVGGDVNDLPAMLNAHMERPSNIVHFREPTGT